MERIYIVYIESIYKVGEARSSAGFQLQLEGGRGGSWRLDLIPPIAFSDPLNLI